MCTSRHASTHVSLVGNLGNSSLGFSSLRPFPLLPHSLYTQTIDGNKTLTLPSGCLRLNSSGEQGEPSRERHCPERLIREPRRKPRPLLSFDSFTSLFSRLCCRGGFFVSADTYAIFARMSSLKIWGFMIFFTDLQYRVFSFFYEWFLEFFLNFYFCLCPLSL